MDYKYFTKGVDQMIFLCFSSQERYTIVKSCLYHLKNYGYDTWYDYHELILGDKKEEKNFVNAIQFCEYFIIIYSNNFFKSPCAITEESRIYAEVDKRDITIFPLLYNIKYAELPIETQNRIENLIYNEVTDETGCISSVNQMVVKMLLDEMDYDEFDFTPHLTSSKIEQLYDKYLKGILSEYINLSRDNFNARVCILYCAYKYIKETITTVNIPYHYCRTIEYLSHYTKLNIPYNHKEIIILELVIMNLLKLIQ